jgi:nicotinate-nucleotide--dimethylbenzimidazole phosphoribosyltransferase
MPSGPTPVTQATAQAAPRWPAVFATAHATLDRQVQERLQWPFEADGALGRLATLARQLARIQAGSKWPAGSLRFNEPQLLVFAADHGIADEGMSESPQEVTRLKVLKMLSGQSPVTALATLHGFATTVVDAGVATPIDPPPTALPTVQLQSRKIGYGTRNMLLNRAMSTEQMHRALQAGMDTVRHLPGNVLALASMGVAGNASAAALVSRLCGAPLADAFGKGHPGDTPENRRQLERLFTAITRHRKASHALDLLAAMGGFETAMLCGAMWQAASERRVVLVDGHVAGAAALVARAVVPEVMDYLVFAHRSTEPGHHLLLAHLKVQPLIDLSLGGGQGLGALMAWPLLRSAQRLLER